MRHPSIRPRSPCLKCGKSPNLAQFLRPPWRRGVWSPIPTKANSTVSTAIYGRRARLAKKAPRELARGALQQRLHHDRFRARRQPHQEY